jgi:exodeoxyribonuclease V beta subunit
MALHQYLLNRDPDYSYEDNFGGVKYLFVRGMDGMSRDYGIFNYRASEELLNQVQYIFNGNGVGGEG